MTPALAEQLVLSWHKNGIMFDAVRRAALCEGEIISKEELSARMCALGCYPTRSRRPIPVRRWMGMRLSMINDMLWDGKPDDAVMAAMLRVSPDSGHLSHPVFGDSGSAEEQKTSECTRFISARSLSKNHDWATVK